LCRRAQQAALQLLDYLEWWLITASQLRDLVPEVLGLFHCSSTHSPS